MGKVIGRFDPTPSRTADECERHYTQVHVRMAQDLLRPMPSLLSYHTDRAVAQADVNGGWNQRPRAWRFVVLRFTPGETLAFTPEQNEMVAQDHVNCLYRLRSCDVEESVLLDRVDRQLRAGQVHDRGGPSRGRRCRRRLGCVQRAGGPGPWCHGRQRSARERLIVNRVLNEVECEPVDVEGQRPIGLLEDTTRVGYIEAYFDHRRWGEEALGVLAAEGALRDPALIDVNLLRVEELAPLDVTGN